MSLSTLKKRKLDTENCQFNNNWTEKFVFIETAEGKPMCLLYTECISVSKEYNLRRHFNTKHPNFNINYPLGSDIQQGKIQTLTSTYECSRAVISRSCSAQEKATIASLRVAWILAKKKRPFTDAETIKECLLAAIGKVVADNKVKDQGCIRNCLLLYYIVGEKQ